MKEKLKAVQIDRYKSGRYPDGGGLILNVTKSDTRSWVFSWRGKQWVTSSNKSGRREMGLGPYPEISLKKAREAAGECRTLIQQGIDPKAHRDNVRKATGPKTFEEVGEEYIELKQSGWRNEKHRAQWNATIKNYCAAIKNTPIAEITKDDVLLVLKPLWITRHETARRVLGRMQNILAYSIARDIRSGPNPADWKGNIEFLVEQVPEASKSVKHFPALDYEQMPAFFKRLETWEALAARALTLLILTATRTSEVLNAEWTEFELSEGLWVVPAERTKMQKPHAIPLPDTAVSLLKELSKHRLGELVFEGQKRGRPLSNMSMLMMLRRHKIENVTPHGFRSTFRDWCQDKTSFESRIAEAALAHSNPNKVEAAYLRSDAFMKRKQLMQSWSDYCQGITSAEVLEFRNG